MERPMWRLHPERNKDGSVRDGAWRYCVDADCAEDHVQYEPFRPIDIGEC